MASDVQLISAFKFPGCSGFPCLIRLYQAGMELHSDPESGTAMKYIHTFHIFLSGKPENLIDNMLKYEAGVLKSRLSFSHQTVTRWLRLVLNKTTRKMCYPGLS